LVDKNPLESVDLIDDINGVMVKGKWFSREKLDEMIQMDKNSVQFRTDFWTTAYNCVHNGSIEPLLDLMKEEENKTLLECGYNSVFKYYLEQKYLKNLPEAFDNASKYILDRNARIRLLNEYAWFIYVNKWEQQYLNGIKAAKEAIELYPNYASFYDTLAWLYFENNQLDDAIKTVKKAIEIAPNRKEYQDNLYKMMKSKK